MSTEKGMRRWALWSPILGFYRPLPHQTEVLYSSRRAAVAARLGGSNYAYKPVRVVLTCVVAGFDSGSGVSRAGGR